MQRTLNTNKKNELYNELKGQYPKLKSEDFDKMDQSIEHLIGELAVKVGGEKNDIEKLVISALERINSKHLI